MHLLLWICRLTATRRLAPPAQGDGVLLFEKAEE
jgi:hypothetical protein